MARVITFSRYYPKGHPKAGQETNFVEKVWRSYIEVYGLDYMFSFQQAYDNHFGGPIASVNDFHPKHHTIRAGNRWKVGDTFSPRIWSGKPYASKQIQFAPDIEIKKVWDVQIEVIGAMLYVQKPTEKANQFLLIPAGEVAQNDGLSYQDFKSWFALHPKKKKEVFRAQILCWNENIEY